MKRNESEGSLDASSDFDFDETFESLPTGSEVLSDNVQGISTTFSDKPLIITGSGDGDYAHASFTTSNEEPVLPTGSEVLLDNAQGISSTFSDKPLIITGSGEYAHASYNTSNDKPVLPTGSKVLWKNAQGVSTTSSDEPLFLPTGSKVLSDNAKGISSTFSDTPLLNTGSGGLLDNDEPLPARYDGPLPAHNGELLPAEFANSPSSDSSLFHSLSSSSSSESDQSDGSDENGPGIVVEPGNAQIEIFERVDGNPDTIIGEIHIQNEEVVDYYTLAASVVDASPELETRNSDKRISGNVLWPWRGFRIDYISARNGTIVPLDPLCEQWEQFKARLDRIIAKREVQDGSVVVPIHLQSLNGNCLTTQIQMRFVRNIQDFTKIIHFIFVAWWRGEQNVESIELKGGLITPFRVISGKCNICFYDKGGEEIPAAWDAIEYSTDEEIEGENDEGDAIEYSSEEEIEGENDEGAAEVNLEENVYYADTHDDNNISDVVEVLSRIAQLKFEDYCGHLGKVVIQNVRR